MKGARQWKRAGASRAAAFVNRHANSNRRNARAIVDGIDMVSWQEFARSLGRALAWGRARLEREQYCFIETGDQLYGNITGLRPKSSRWLYENAIHSKQLKRAARQMTLVRDPGGNFFVDGVTRLSGQQIRERIAEGPLLVLDDMCISGSQVGELLRELHRYVRERTEVFVCIPYVTANAKVDLTEMFAPSAFHLRWSPHEVIRAPSPATLQAVNRLYPFLAERQQQIGAGTSPALSVFQHKTPDAASLPFPVEYGLIGGSHFPGFSSHTDWRLHDKPAVRFVPLNAPPYKVSDTEWRQLERVRYARAMHPFYDEVTTGGELAPLL